MSLPATPALPAGVKISRPWRSLINRGSSNQPNFPTKLKSPVLVGMTGSKATAWSLRVAASETVDKNLRTWCEKRGVVLAVKEFGDDESPNQEHYHLLLRTELLTDTAVRKWVEQLMGGKSARADKTLKVLPEEEDVEKFLRYCCKGPNWHDVKLGNTSDRTPPIVSFTTLLPATIQAYHDDFWKENTKRKEALKPKKKLSPDEVVQLCIAYLKPKGHTDYWDCHDDASDWLLAYYKGYREDRYLGSAVQSVMWHMDRPNTEMLVRKRMRERMDRYRQGVINMTCQAQAPEKDIHGNIISLA